MPVPVITGIGHEQDRVAADEVAHTATPTPTAAAAFLCSIVRTADDTLHDATAQMTALATRHMATAAQAIKGMADVVLRRAIAGIGGECVQIRSLRERYTAHGRRSLAPHEAALHRCCESLKSDAQWALREEGATVLEMENSLAVAATQQTRRKAEGLAEDADDVATLVQRQLVAQARHHAYLMADLRSSSEKGISEPRRLLSHLDDIVRAYDPVHVLRRGFSITLNRHGQVVKAAADLAFGEPITTRLAAGEVVSTVTQTTRKDQEP
jgi:exodeoxyribonuclease VII large subunit